MATNINFSKKLGVPNGTSIFIKPSGVTPQSLINAFKIRVAADSGMYEAESCQLATLTTLNSIA